MTETVLKRLEDLNRALSLDELGNILNSTVKYDVDNKLVTFLIMILNYTAEDQQNIGYSAESSTGKSYIALELSNYFPQDDVMILGYTSPTAFFHEQGEWDEDQSVKVINLNKKILVFTDQPHDMLLQRLRPLLSHDKKIIRHKITDRRKGGLRTRSIDIIGYPTVIFCTTKFSMAQEERTRLILLSPEVTHVKIDAALELLADKLRNRKEFREMLSMDPSRKFLMDRVQGIRTANIEEIIIPHELIKKTLERFRSDHKYLIPRHQRDFPVLIALIKGHALLNMYQRERTEGQHDLIANEEDMEAGYELYRGISKSNELGIPPEVYHFYENVFNVAVELEGYTTRRNLTTTYYKIFHKTIGKRRMAAILDMLLESGLIVEDANPADKREKIYCRPQDSIQVVGHLVGGTRPPKLNAPAHVGIQQELGKYDKEVNG